MVGQNQKYIQLGIANNKRHPIKKDNWVYNPEELSNLAEGLRQLKLRSLEEIEIEPPTGVMFPKLAISLFDSNGNLLKKIYAQDNGDNMIGNAVISVDKFKDELAKLSKLFKDRLTTVNNTQEQPARESIGKVIFRFVLFSLVIGLIAMPTYLFAKSKNDLFLWFG